MLRGAILFTASILVMGAFIPSLATAEIDASGITLHLLETASGARKMRGEAPTGATPQLITRVPANPQSAQCATNSLTFNTPSFIAYTLTAAPKAKIPIIIPAGAVPVSGIPSTERPPADPDGSSNYWVQLIFKLGAANNKQVFQKFKATGEQTIDVTWPDAAFTFPTKSTIDNGDVSVQISGFWTVQPAPSGPQPACITVRANATAADGVLILPGKFDGPIPTYMGGTGVVANNTTNETGNETANETADNDTADENATDENATGNETTDTNGTEPTVNVTGNNTAKDSGDEGGIPGFGLPAFALASLAAVLVLRRVRTRRGSG